MSVPTSRRLTIWTRGAAPAQPNVTTLVQGQAFAEQVKEALSGGKGGAACDGGLGGGLGVGGGGGGGGGDGGGGGGDLVREVGVSVR